MVRLLGWTWFYSTNGLDIQPFILNHLFSHYNQIGILVLELPAELPYRR